MSISGSTNVTDPGNNSIVCITGGGTYTGTINMNQRNGVTICVAAGTTFSGTITNWKNNFVVNNYGTWTTASTLNSDATFNNTGTVNIAGGWTIAGTVTSTGPFSVSGDFSVGSGTQHSLTGTNTFGGNFGMNSTTAISLSNAAITGTLTVGGNFTATGAVTAGGAVTVNSGKTLTAASLSTNNTFSMSGNATISGALNATGAITVGSSTTLTAAAVSTNSTFSMSGNATISGPLNAAGNVTVNSGTTLSATALTTGGTLAATGSANISGPVSATGAITVNSSATLSGTSVTTGASLTVTGTFTASGAVTVATTCDVNSNANATFGTGSSMGTNMTVNGSVKLTGTFSVGGFLTNNSNGSITTAPAASSCNSLSVTGTFTNYGSINGGTGKNISMNKAPNPNAGGANTAVVAPPVAQPGALNLTANGNSYNGSFAAASPAPVGYAVLRKRGSAIATSAYPAFGTTITNGSYYKGAKIVALLPAATRTFTDAPDSCGTFYYTVVSMSNASGSCAAYATGASSSGANVAGSPNGSTIAYGATSYCKATTLTNVSRTGAAGGTYSISPAGLAFNNTTGAINPSASNTGNYTMTYTIAAGTNGCVSATTSTANVQVVATPAASIGYSSPSYCTSASTKTVVFSGTLGGTYSASSSDLSINPTSGAIKPGQSTAGSYTVTYTIAATNGCAVQTATANVTIEAPTTNAVSYNRSTYCTSQGTMAASFTGVSGGTYSAAPSGLSINPSSGAINPGQSTAGSYTVTYTPAASASCPLLDATFPVTITENSASFGWAGGSAASLATPASWIPSRGAVGSCDVLSFANGGTVTASSVPSQTFKKIVVSNNTNLTLTAVGTANLTLTGDNGVALEIEEGSTLTLNSTNLALTAQPGSEVLVKGTLSLANGTLNVSGASVVFASSIPGFVPIVRTNGKLTTSSATNITFGATGKTAMAYFALPNDLFTNSPASVNNFTMMTDTAKVRLGNQDLAIYGTFSRPSGTSVLRLNGRALSIRGAVSGNPTLHDNTGTSSLAFYGVDDVSGLRFYGTNPYLHNLVLNRTYAKAIEFPAGSNLRLGGSITFTKGIAATKTNKITLIPGAALTNETDSSHIRGQLEETATLAQGVLHNFSNMRVSIQANGNAPGVTTITRLNDDVVAFELGNSVRLRYIITPTVDTLLNATLNVKLLPSEMMGQNALTIIFARKKTPASRWEKMGITSYTAPLLFSLSGIDHFSTWTLGEELSVLPATLASFTAKATSPNQVDLAWETSIEQDNAGFALFRMTDGETFDSIAYIQPKPGTDGRTRYTFKDLNPGLNNIYRLRQYDYSGNATTYPLVFVNTGEAPELGYLSVFPNPMKDDKLSLLNKGTKNRACSLTLRSRDGALLYSGKASLSAGRIEALSLPHLAPGSYILEVQDDAGAKHFLRVIKI